ncbi:MAG: cation:proton antiporter [Gammaproteobacteria bacterium]|nr:cation:proton antiporter [Gammaproteobacteria bacterium]MBT7369943.1 cation:proton antiporter [Gammaproteobacteria bacterium]
MAETIQLLLVLGCLFLIGVAVDTIGRHTSVPHVTLLMCVGIAVGTGGFDLLPDTADAWFHPIAVIALAMVGFLLGEKFTLENLRRHGKVIFSVSLGASIGTCLVVGTILLLIGTPFPLAVLLAGIAAATDPAATADVVREARVESGFSNELLGIVALDDAWGLIVFSLCTVLAAYSGADGAISGLVVITGLEIGGAILLGLCIGLPAALLSGRLDPGQPSLLEALGIVFICGGLSLWLEVSFLIAAMVMGATVANLARHHERPFHEIEGIEGPFLVLFFLLAGASLDLSAVDTIGILMATYIASRFAGKIVGSWLGVSLAGASDVTRRWMGLALTPQAGVAIGMALIANDRFPEYGDVLLPTVIASTIFFELTGPIFTRIALQKSEGSDD